MDEQERPKPLDLGVFSRGGEGPAVSSIEIIAAGLSLAWLLGTTLFFVFASGREGAATGIDPMRLVLALVAIFMPVALIWVAAIAIRAGRTMKEESERLQAAINAMRHSYIEQQQAGIVSLKPDLERKLDEIAAAQRKTDATLAMFTSVRPAAAEEASRQKAALGDTEEAPTGAGEQPSLALGTPAEAPTPPLSVADFIRALHFPESPDDKEGFRVLRRALQDRSVSPLVQAAQDVLTLLSQDGIYMDDLTPDRAHPDLWRRFARGERGREMAALGGIRDRASLALAAGRMRQDTVFRDSVHHFLRKFDRTFSTFEKTATDQEIIELTDTRTARAFMLLGRAAGTFD